MSTETNVTSRQLVETSYGLPDRPAADAANDVLTKLLALEDELGVELDGLASEQLTQRIDDLIAPYMPSKKRKSVDQKRMRRDGVEDMFVRLTEFAAFIRWRDAEDEGPLRSTHRDSDGSWKAVG